MSNWIRWTGLWSKQNGEILVGAVGGLRVVVAPNRDKDRKPGDPDYFLLAAERTGNAAERRAERRAEQRDERPKARAELPDDGDRLATDFL
jgi:hypothetical protein